MSKQIAIRLPDRGGRVHRRRGRAQHAPSRAAFVQIALDRERRRLIAARDAELLAGISGDPEAFDGPASYAADLDTGLPRPHRQDSAGLNDIVQARDGVILDTVAVLEGQFGGKAAKGSCNRSHRDAAELGAHQLSREDTIPAAALGRQFGFLVPDQEAVLSVAAGATA